MSGICGVLRFDEAPINQRIVRAMTAAMGARGPDRCGDAVGERVAMGHVLLRVNREDRTDEQPIVERDVILAADLRLDNRNDLAGELGIDANSLAELPDSELLLAAYRAWGCDCVPRLIGDFAFAIYDTRQQKLLLARDHMGQRGLFYHHGPDAIRWASEIGPLWMDPGVPRGISDETIGRALLFAIDRPADETAFAGICALPGGTMVIVGPDETMRIERYWQPAPDPQHLSRPEDELIAAYRDVLTEAIACRVRRVTRSPALSFSGGFDSAVIAAVAGPLLATMGRRLHAVASVLPEGDGRPDARPLVEPWRDRPWLDISYHLPGYDDNALTALEAGFARSYLPVPADPVRDGLLRLARGAGARLMLDGLGGDYTLHPRFEAPLWEVVRSGGWSRLLRELWRRRIATGWRWSTILRRDLLRGMVPLRVAALSDWLRRRGRPVWRTRPAARGLAQRLIEDGVIDPGRLRQRRQIHARGRQLHCRFLETAATMWPIEYSRAGGHGVDFTRPYHDKRVVELALAIPPHLMLRDGLERALPRRVWGDVLPAALLCRSPGNVPMAPGNAAADRDAALAALADLRATRGKHAGDALFDLDRMQAMVAGAQSGNSWAGIELQFAVRAIVMNRFVRWFDRRNRSDQGNIVGGRVTR